ncbi:hypothetical protein [Streptomyces sp. YIM S03343]
MKSLKAAAVVAGSLALAGTAAPAFAYNSADLTPTSLNGGVNTLTKGPLDLSEASPLHHQSHVLDTESKDSVLSTAKEAADTLNQHKPLLGGLPLHG